jgi:hypothetical protein
VKTIITTAAVLAAIAMPAHATDEGAHGRYTYKCHGASGYGTIKVDEDKGTLTWRGTTFQNLKQVEGAKVTWQATNNNVTAELSTATKGVADLTIGEASFDRQMKR